MKSYIVIFVLIISTAHISVGQTQNYGFEKVITTIEFFGNHRSDTVINSEKYDTQGHLIREFKGGISVSYPIRIDTNQISDETRMIEYIWEDKSKSYLKEVITSKEISRIAIDKNGTDTIYFSKFKLGRKGLPIEGIIISHSDTTKYIIQERLLLDEVFEIQQNILKKSEFIDFLGIIHFHSKRHLTITDSNEKRNKTKIILNKRLQPKKVILQKWHDYHKRIFENKYSYKYESNQLVELRNVDDYGDLEMIRIIEYRMK